jgi:membrane peptidoglycan carboxypeptidase
MVIRTLVFLFFISGAIFFGGLSFVVHNHVVDFSALANYNPGRPSIIFDDEGNEWARFELDKREPVLLEAIPFHVQQAFIAAEDRTFFSHAGISVRSIVRSLIVNVYHRRKAQGASTITQQLVKLLFFDCKKTFKRKIKEQFLSLLVERQFTKEQILEIYLNHICFGCGIYGIEAAAQRFWGKRSTDLTLAEGATLAAILVNPSRYCPLLHPERTKLRRNTVLRAMVEVGFITQEEADVAQNEPLELIKNSTHMIGPHVREAIRQMLEEYLGKHMLYTGGLIIQSTINSSIQKQAQRSFRDKMSAIRKDLGNNVDGGLIMMHGSSGEIKALVGGYSFHESQYNRALFPAKRQMGSIFKPIVYAAAIEQGRSFAEVELDEPVEFTYGGREWRPQNNTRVFEGEMTLAEALSRSNNIIAIKTFLRTGAEHVIELARKMNIPGDMPRYPSLALGCIDVSVKDAVGAFNVFAHNGYYIEPHFVRWVKNQCGTKIYRYQPRKRQVLTPRVSGQVAKVLSVGMPRYLARYKVDDFKPETITKTGTTNDSRTCWFAGATAEYTTVVYVGRDDNTPLGHNIYPLWTSFPIWFDLYRAVANHSCHFSYDPSLRKEIIAWRQKGAALTTATIYV